MSAPDEHGVFQDWSANPRNPKIQIFLAAFRLAQRLSHGSRPVRLLAAPYLVLYRVVFEWILGMELHWNLRIGPRLRIFHGYGLVVNAKTVIGADCTLRHCTTFGNKDEDGEAPVLGDRVDVGCHSVILGPVEIGSDAVIGAGSVVTRSVPAGAVAAGNPAEILRPALPEGATRAAGIEPG